MLMKNPSAPLVYIVDDDDAVRAALAMLVEAQGWHVRAYGSARDFLRNRARRPTTSCLLLDMHLPGMHGAELTEALRRRGKTMPTVVLTAEPENPLAKRAIAAGAQTVLGKPCEPGELIANLAETLGTPPGTQRAKPCRPGMA